MIKKLFYCLLISGMSMNFANAQIIENFESGLSTGNTLDYRNQNLTPFSILNCQIGTSFGSLYYPNFSSYDNASEKASIVSVGNYDPILASYGIQKDVVPPNGGKFAIRLNDVVSGYQDITAFEKVVNLAPRNVSFNYMSIFDSGHIADLEHQTFFTFRVLDQNRNVISGTQYCLVADPANSTLINQNNHLFYTDGWLCHSVTIPKIYVGKKVILQFIAADCGAGKDRGITYIDNIVGEKECTPMPIGSIKLVPIENNCAPKEKVQVCGTFEVPGDNTLTNLELEVLHNGNVVTLAPGDVNIDNLDATSFCFNVYFNSTTLPPTGTYEFRVKATYVSNSTGQTFEVIAQSTNPGADVSFGGTVNYYFDNDVLHWDNFGGPYIIELRGGDYCCPGSTANAHAEGLTTTVVVNDNFINGYELIQAIGSKCLQWRIKLPCGEAWSDWCCMASYYPSSGPHMPIGDNFNVGCSPEGQVNNKPAQLLVVYPNPTSSFVHIINSNSMNFDLYDYNNNLVFSKKVKAIERDVELDITHLKAGVYILKTDNKQTVKIMKK
ncbi:T9SS type A sorting domain-containing protein [Flavobacterium sp. '19STA2R22 D10 B1']|uniref:T9SS type A sorting domain-containing protein n=1 Tax=Flavobacterium aerium TaxID=3037261 RepID=UPI00278BBBF3|nr:T9SS type A sorting domain-containing protein [Flavobacterium sp. '19STA2R22 D10 B1']